MLSVDFTLPLPDNEGQARVRPAVILSVQEDAKYKSIADGKARTGTLANLLVFVAPTDNFHTANGYEPVVYVPNVQLDWNGFPGTYRTPRSESESSNTAEPTSPDPNANPTT
jgi:hypothetical protein